MKSRKYLPWLSQDIKSKMKERKKLYDKAKRTQYHTGLQEGQPKHTIKL